jgi:large subunit ribosomal protein L6
MSRVGNKPIDIPKGVKLEVRGDLLHAEGPKGKMAQKMVPGYPVEIKDGRLTVSRKGDTGPERAGHGLARALYANAVKGVTEGFTKVLEVVGVGYKVELKGDVLQMALGYSHPVIYKVPGGLKVDVDAKAGKVTISGPDRQMVGQAAAEIRSFKKPDPYKGKGVKYADEVIRRKEGKAGAK